jgi:hypothetical protein
MHDHRPPLSRQQVVSQIFQRYQVNYGGEFATGINDTGGKNCHNGNNIRLLTP